MNFQKRVLNWLMACFSNEIFRDVTEQNHRFLEESLELVQSTGCTASEAHQLVDYVFGRPSGDTFQEVGGVRVTLSALCSAIELDEDGAAETELARVTVPATMERFGLSGRLSRNILHYRSTFRDAKTRHRIQHARHQGCSCGEICRRGWSRCRA